MSENGRRRIESVLLRMGYGSPLVTAYPQVMQYYIEIPGFPGLTIGDQSVFLMSTPASLADLLGGRLGTNPPRLARCIMSMRDYVFDATGWAVPLPALLVADTSSATFNETASTITWDEFNSYTAQVIRDRGALRVNSTGRREQPLSQSRYQISVEPGMVQWWGESEPIPDRRTDVLMEMPKQEQPKQREYKRKIDLS